MSKKNRKRIASLERKTAHLADLIDIIISQDPDELARIENIEQQIGYLEAMVRHYIIALYEQNKTTTTPTIVPSQKWPVPIPPGGLNIPFPYPYDTTTGTTLHDPKGHIGIGSTIGSGTACGPLRSAKLPENEA